MHLYEHLFPQMRKLDEEMDREYQQNRKLGPRNGEIPVGGAHIDPLIRAECIRGVMKGLREEKSEEEIKQLGIDSYKLVVAKWNASREWQVHRSDCNAEMYTIGIMRKAGLLT